MSINHDHVLQIIRISAKEELWWLMDELGTDEVTILREIGYEDGYLRHEFSLVGEFPNRDAYELYDLANECESLKWLLLMDKDDHGDMEYKFKRYDLDAWWYMKEDMKLVEELKTELFGE